MALPADPRDRLAQIPEKGLRKMFLPHTIPVEEMDAEKKGQKAPVIVIVNDGAKSLGDILRGLIG